MAELHRWDRPWRWLGQLSLLLLLLVPRGGIHAQTHVWSEHFASHVPPARLRWGRAAVLLEYRTGEILFAHRMDQLHAPASLTKLVTAYLALERAAESAAGIDERLPVDPQSYWTAMPSGSSLMFLNRGQIVSTHELLMGLLVSSGNDAAVEIAIRASGSVAEFVAEMNSMAATHGYDSFTFVEPAGLSPRNTITALEFASFARSLISRYPIVLTDYTSRPSFSYPTRANIVGGRAPESITQANRNRTLDLVAGTDGLKTGYIDESGYNIAVTAARSGMRLIAVVLGVEADNHGDGGVRRAQSAQTLLEWGFANARLGRGVVPRDLTSRVYGGTTRTVPVESRGEDFLVFPAVMAGVVRAVVELDEVVWAPIASGRRVGTITYLGDNEVLHEMVLVAASPVEAGTIVRRWTDRLRLFFRRLRAAMGGADRRDRTRATMDLS